MAGYASGTIRRLVAPFSFAGTIWRWTLGEGRPKYLHTATTLKDRVAIRLSLQLTLLLELLGLSTL